MSDWKPDSGEIGVQPVTEISSTQQHPLGYCISGKDYGTTDYGIGKFMYVKGVASAALGSALSVEKSDYSTALLTANAIGDVGFSMGALIADTYGWVQTCGRCVGLGLASLADNANLYATATAGSLDDAVVAGDQLKGANTISALDTPATGQVEIEANYPYTDNV